VSLVTGVEPVRSVLERPHGLLEGPRFGPRDELVYSDVLAGGLFACASGEGGPVRELLPKRRGIGGVVAHEDGGWVISGRTLVHLAPDGSQRELRGEAGACGYNDLGTTPDGELLAGVLRFRPFAGEEPCPGQLLVLDRDGGERVLSEEILWPNGIGMGEDGHTVYVSDYARRAVFALDLEGGPARELAGAPQGSADGLALDADGGIWVALGEGGGVARLLPDGSVDEVVELPASFVSSLCFGGADMREMLVTTADNEERPELGGTLLRARCAIAGARVYPVGV
jgi:gluconolactonase